jgi:NNP family nitrate/nitrite transporter-like MFS transporter
MEDSVTVTDPRPETATPPAAATPTETAPAEAALSHRPGRWIDNWNPENATQWAKEGKAIAARNLRWSIFAEFLGFVVWQLWSVVVVSLPAAGFQLSTGEIFWLISMPSLVGATLRIPYTFMVPRFGGRNWTIVSAGLLLIPSIGLAIAVSNPATPFGLLLLIAGFAGFGGGNFASSMSNITFFYPAAQKGYALGLNAAGGNLGASVAQFVVPIVITVGAAATLNLPLAGLIWVPLILVAMVGAYLRMDNLSAAKADITASLAALKEPHMWVLSLLYIGTFGSFIGFAGVFPKLLADTFPDFKGIAIGTATVTLAFLGALVGSLARPYGGKLADRFGGTVITIGAFTVMGLGILSVILTLPMQNFAIFLLCFLVLFAAAGIGNGSTYRMIPTIFALKANGGIGAQRKAAAALGLISAIGAYGGFFIPQLLGFSKTTFGSYTPALGWFALAYVAFLALTAGVYLRMSKKTGTRI